MSNPTIPENIQKRIREISEKNPHWSASQIAKELRKEAGRLLSKDVICKYRSTPKVNAPTEGGESETSTVTQDTWNISLPRTSICTLEELVEKCKIDLDVWQVDRWSCRKWDMGAKEESSSGEGKQRLTSSKLVIKELYAVSATLKRRVAIDDARKEIEELKQLAKRLKYSPFDYKPSKTSTGKMLELNIPDAHFGKLAWAVETGGANYDTKIAEQTFMTAVDTLLDRVNAHKFDEIWFVVGNDMLNSDTKEGTTTSGTPVSNDTRYHKTFQVVRSCVIRCIERLRKLAGKKVKVIMVSGNHDNMSVFHLGDSAECYFHDKRDVEIDNSPKKFKFHQFGKVMLMFTHGDKGKKNDYPLLMATQQTKMFGATKFHETHTGHTHMTKVDEQHGVRVRVLPALCPADDWHAENGLMGNQRSAEAFVWDAEEGLIGTAIYTVVEE